MSLSSRVSDLATRIGLEIKAVRAEVTSAISTHAGLSDPHTGYLRESVLTAKGDVYIATASGVVVRKAIGADGSVLTADSSQADGAAWAVPTGGAPDATTSSKGIVQLAGDLGGTAASPTVPGLAGKAASTHASQHASGGSDPVTPLSIGADKRLTPTATKTGSYTAVDGDLVMVDATSGNITITAPASGSGVEFGVKKIDSSTNIVTVQRAGSDTIGATAATSVPISLQDQAINFQANGTNWVISENNLGLANLDTRYITNERVAARTLANARITRRTVDISSTATFTHDADSYDQANITAQAAALSIANPTGTPTSGQLFMLRIKDNGTARAITWSGSQWRAVGVTLPTTTVISKVLYIGAVWNAAETKWDVIALAQQA